MYDVFFFFPFYLVMFSAHNEYLVNDPNDWCLLSWVNQDTDIDFFTLYLQTLLANDTLDKCEKGVQDLFLFSAWLFFHMWTGECLHLEDLLPPVYMTVIGKLKQLIHLMGAKNTHLCLMS